MPFFSRSCSSLQPGAIWWFSKNLGRSAAISAGKDEAFHDDPARRWRMYCCWLRAEEDVPEPLVALMHFVIYAALSSSISKCWK